VRDWPELTERQKLASAFVLYLVLLAALATAGYDFYFDQERRFEADARSQLSTIADLKAAQLAEWRKERISDGDVVRTGPAIMPAIQRFLRGGSADEVTALLESWRSVQSVHGYSSITVLDDRGVVRLALGSERQHIGACRSLASEAIERRQVVLSDLHRENGSGSIHLAVAVPVPGQTPQNVSGVILLWIDPRINLYPLVQAWPGISKTGESLLVRRDGDHVVFLNELRHRQNAALPLNLPIEGHTSAVPSVRAVSGYEGTLSGPDYRGVEVMAATRRVPDSPWYLVVKIDAKEIDIPAHQRSHVVSMVLLFCLLATGPGIGLVWYTHRSRLRFVKHESEVARRALIGHYSYLSRHANDIILLEEEDGRIIEANERTEQTYGYSHEELLGLNIRDLTDHGSLIEFDCRWKATLNPGGVIYETVHRRKDGSAFPVEVSARVIEVDGETFRQTIIRDITERKKSEERVRRAGAYNRRLIETSLDPLVTIDPEGRIADVNKATEEVTGYSREELLGTDFSEYFTEPDRARAAYKTAFRDGQIEDYELEIRHRDGHLTSVTYNASVYRDKAGEIVGVFAAARDITERKRIHSELARLNQELEHRVQERTSELAAANSELEAFTYSVSHDLRAPLRGIHGFSRILNECYATQLSADARHYLEMVDQNALTMGSLIDSLLSLSRLNRQPLKLQAVEPASLVRAALVEMADEIDGRRIEFVIDDLPHCTADSVLLKQVWINLLSNAVKYTRRRENAWIHVGWSRFEELKGPGKEEASNASGSWVDQDSPVYYVADNGAGFDMRYADKLFGVFQRLHSQAEYEGTGVGLAIVERIIRRHGGRVWAYGRHDVGASFYFTVGGR
jgi:PAS domain S-box-containing protein